MTAELELDRRFAEGDAFTIPPHEYRVRRGRKSPADLVLEWRYLGERDMRYRQTDREIDESDEIGWRRG
jgi:hypothetical protein